MKTLSELNQEADRYFEQLNREKAATQKAYEYILSTLDTALNSQDCTKLLSLIPYIETGEGQLAFQYIGESHRILRVLHIIEAELKFQGTIFCADCKNASQLRTKYMLTLFALRRLLFRLSNESAMEAMLYLQETPISPVAAYIITQDDLLIPNQELYENLIGIYAKIWPAVDLNRFMYLIQQP